MRLQFLLLLSLAACAGSPSRSEYQQSAFPPGAPAFNPTMDAPHSVGQPGYVAREEVPRSPYTRVLPETELTRREPGLWAVALPPPDKRLPAANPAWPDPPVILGTPLPYVLLTNTEDDRYYARRCAGHVATAKRLVAVDVDALSVFVRRCLAARLYVVCLELAGHTEAAANPYFKAHIDAAKRRAEGFAKDLCEDVPHSTEADTFLLGMRFRLARDAQ